MDARSLIAALRRGERPGEDALIWFANGLADGTVSDAQAGAFAMAVCLQGLGTDGRAALTRGMRDTGRVLRWDLPGPVVDKHSTGGVGDCVSLLLAPALAVCGAYVPMISGRGLGHTGGTLDKLEAIPGLSVDLSEERLKAQVAGIGCAIAGAGPGIAPADRRLYAIRDVTATVESRDLITASILSKKLAAAPEALVLDVKVGSGAFMKSPGEARDLAQALVETACAAGCPTSALVTDMSQPLAPALGNALEVAEVMRVLTGEVWSGPLLHLTAILGGVLLDRADLARDVQEGADLVAAAIRDGRAAERFDRMLQAQGASADFSRNWKSLLPEADVVREVRAPRAGFLSAIDGEALGLAVVALGGGRQVEGDRIDPSVGLSDLPRLGARIEAGQPLARIHAAREDAALAAERAVLAAMTVSDAQADAPDLIRERIG